ncbi:MAG: type VI secretion system tip protein VgrG [Neisseriaceae bacterium]|nr:type VI secretion system tip protein VgrG [Neisseriaceae bacterium]
MAQRYYFELGAELAQYNALSVHSFSVTERLDECYEVVVELTSADPQLPLAQFIHQRAQFSMRPEVQWGALTGVVSRQQLGNEDTSQRHWHGVITAAEKIAGNVEESRYRLTLMPRLALLDRIETSRLFQNETALSIVAKILRHHGFGGEDFKLQSARTLPHYEHRMQYQETDYAFIRRVLAREGLWFGFNQSSRADVLVVGDALAHYQQIEANQALAFKPDRGLESPRLDVTAQVEAALAAGQGGRMAQSVSQSLGQTGLGEAAIHAFSLHYQPQFAGVTVKDYNYRDAPNALVGTSAFDYERPAAAGKPYLYGAYHHKDQAQAQSYAELRHQQSMARHETGKGRGNVATLRPGEVFGFAAGAQIGPYQHWLVLAVVHRGGRSVDYQNEFEAIPATTLWRPAERRQPRVQGTMAGVVCDAGQGPYAWVDELGRYTVKLRLDLDDWQPGGESRPIRLAKPYAGASYGQHFPLHVDTEVQLAFQQGDPDRPYIVGVLHNSSAPDHVPNAWRTRNVLRTWANNKIRLEDLAGQEHIKVATEFQKSQLNLGHLVDGSRSQRGEGFELRSDGYGVLRSAKALYLSTEAQSQAVGLQLARDEALTQLEGALAQARHLADVQQKHLGGSPALSQLSQLADTASALSGPVLLTSAPAGIAQTTAASMLNSIGTDWHTQAGQHVVIGAGEQMSFTSVKALSVLAQTEDLNLIAGKGVARLAAHGAEAEVTAAKKVTVQSVGDEVLINAKSGITLASGGAYIQIKDGRISLYSPGAIEYKGSHQFQGPAGGEFPMPELPGSVCLECLRKARAQGVGIVAR